MGIFNVGQSLSKNNPRIIAALDIGTSKVSAMIARMDGADNLHVLGWGVQASRGLRMGVVVDMEALSAAIAAAIHSAEEMADETVHGVLVSLSPVIVQSHMLSIQTTIGERPIEDSDMRRMIAEACHSVEQTGQMIIHTIPVRYDIDAAKGIRDPRGMFGDILRANVFILGANHRCLRNIAACIERCHLDVSGFVLSNYASGLSVLVEDELDLGVTVIDMGAGSTAVSIFYDGKLCYSDHVSVGGAHITGDIARGLMAPLAYAERLKTVHGSAMVSPSDERERLIVPQIGEDDPHKGAHITKAELVRIIRPRVEETFEMIREKLRLCPYGPLVGKRLVLTGGASQLPGILQMANVILDKQGRLGKPLHMTGASQAFRVPAFASAAGLLVYGRIQGGEAFGLAATKSPGRFGVLSRMGQWIKQNV